MSHPNPRPRPHLRLLRGSSSCSRTRRVRFLVDRVDGSATTRARRANGRRARGVTRGRGRRRSGGSRRGFPGRNAGRFPGVGRASRESSVRAALFDEYDFDDDGFLNRDEVSRFASRRCPSPPPPTSDTSPPRSTWTETERCPSASSWTPSRNVATPNAIRRRRRRTRRRTRANTRRRWRRFAMRDANDVDARRCSRRATSTVVAREAPELSEMIARLAPGASRAERRRMLVGTHRAAATTTGKSRTPRFFAPRDSRDSKSSTRREPRWFSASRRRCDRRRRRRRRRMDRRP